MREHDFEPIAGLPEALPEGEVVLWQGAPSWKPFALRTLQVRLIAPYFAALAAWHLADGWAADPVAAALGALRMLGIGLVPVLLLLLLGWLAGRTTLYTITTRRVVMRVGVALPMTVNIPFAAIRAADLRLFRGGTGDIVLRLASGHRASWVALWPHARSLRITHPEPVLRALPDAEAAGAALARALAASAAMPARAMPGTTRPADGRGLGPEAAAAA